MTNKELAIFSPAMGLGDGWIDAQKVRMIHDTFTKEHALLALETLLDKLDGADNPVVASLSSLVRGKEEFYAEAFNAYILAYALGESPHLMLTALASPDGSDTHVRPMLRARFKLKARVEARKKYPHKTKEEIHALVDEEITDERIVEAIATVAERNGVKRQGVTDWWAWLVKNWNWQIFFSILGILVMFI